MKSSASCANETIAFNIVADAKPTVMWHVLGGKYVLGGYYVLGGKYARW